MKVSAWNLQDKQSRMSSLEYKSRFSVWPAVNLDNKVKVKGYRQHALQTIYENVSVSPK